MSEALPKEEIAKAVSDKRAWAVKSLGEFVSHPSVLGQEKSAQEYIAGIYDQLGYTTKLEAIDWNKIKDLPGCSPADWSYDDRPNVVGLHEPKNDEGRSLILQGHVDVVSPEPLSLWKSDPFRPRVVQNEEDGEEWMYGRGAADMKGGSMCFLWALAALKDAGYEPASKVILQSPIEEECTGNGALALCANGYTADACLIPEPFKETILTHQVGTMWFQVRILGKTTHVLGTGRGVNAIEKSWVIIQALRELEEEVNKPENRTGGYEDIEHPINLNVGIINGGDWASTVAGECVTRFRFAVYPGQSCEDLRKKIEETVAKAAQNDAWLKDFPPNVEYIGFQAIGSRFDRNSEFGKALDKAHHAFRGESAESLKVTCTTDIRFYNEYYGIPSTCYGPKQVNIHGVDEKVSIDSMNRVAEVMALFIQDWCGLRKVR